MTMFLFLSFFSCLFFFLGKADSNNVDSKTIISMGCEKYDLTDGTHYLQITQNADAPVIIQIECDNGNMLVESDAYMNYFQDITLSSDTSKSSITVVDDSDIETGINPIEDTNTSRKKWKSKSEYIIFLVIIIMISVFGVGVFLILYWCFCQQPKINNDNPNKYDYDENNEYYHLQTQLKNKHINNVEYVPIPTKNDNDDESHNNDNNENQNINIYNNTNNNDNNGKYGAVSQQQKITV